MGESLKEERSKERRRSGRRGERDSGERDSGEPDSPSTLPRSGAAASAHAKQLRKEGQRRLEKKTERQLERKSRQSASPSPPVSTELRPATAPPLLPPFSLADHTGAKSGAPAGVESGAPAGAESGALAGDACDDLAGIECSALDRFPEGVWLIIFSALPIRTLGAAACAAHDLHRLVATDAGLWQALHVSLFGTAPADGGGASEERRPESARAPANVAAAARAAAASVRRVCCESEAHMLSWERLLTSAPTPLPLAHTTALCLLNEEVGASVHEGGVVRLWAQRSGRRLACYAPKHPPRNAITCCDAAIVAGAGSSRMDGDETLEDVFWQRSPTWTRIDGGDGGANDDGLASNEGGVEDGLASEGGGGGVLAVGDSGGLLQVFETEATDFHPRRVQLERPLLHTLLLPTGGGGLLGVVCTADEVGGAPAVVEAYDCHLGRTSGGVRLQWTLDLRTALAPADGMWRFRGPSGLAGGEGRAFLTGGASAVAIDVERGVATWEALGADDPGELSFGLGALALAPASPDAPPHAGPTGRLASFCPSLHLLVGASPTGGCRLWDVRAPSRPVAYISTAPQRISMVKMAALAAAQRAGAARGLRLLYSPLLGAADASRSPWPSIKIAGFTVIVTIQAHGARPSGRRGAAAGRRRRRAPLRRPPGGERLDARTCSCRARSSGAAGRRCPRPAPSGRISHMLRCGPRRASRCGWRPLDDIGVLAVARARRRRGERGGRSDRHAGESPHEARTDGQPPNPRRAKVRPAGAKPARPLEAIRLWTSARSRSRALSFRKRHAARVPTHDGPWSRPCALCLPPITSAPRLGCACGSLNLLSVEGSPGVT